MSAIKIKHFGPIKEGYQEDDGFMEIKKVTVLIGNQGSGKSTVAKLIATFSWLEKAINKGEFDINQLTFHFFYSQFDYQGLKDYFLPETEIEYRGEAYSIIYNEKYEWPIVTPITDGSKYIVPKIMYVPAERNFLSVIEDAYNVKNLPSTLYTFGQEYKRAQRKVSGKIIDLPVNDYKYRYDSGIDTSTLIGNNHEINLLKASSGLQSLIPLYLVSKNLAEEIKQDGQLDLKQLSLFQLMKRNEELEKIILDNNLSPQEKDEKTKDIYSRYINRCFINIVEEPELNLFPDSQWQMLKSLLEYNNLNEGNKLIITTHSPYLINYLTLAVEADMLKEKIKTKDIENKLKDIVPLSATVNPKDLAIYELNEIDGTIHLLENYKGIPSDENLLNNELGEGNELFAQLLEIGQKL